MRGCLSAFLQGFQKKRVSLPCNHFITQYNITDMRNLLMAALLLVAGSMNILAQELTAAFKKDNEVNPLIPYNLCADPTAVEYGGRLYVYGTNDRQEYETTKDKTVNTYGHITQLVCMSSADLVNWTFHGIIDVKALSPWIYTAWAPSIVSRMEADEQTHFYMYYTNSASGIGVLTSTSPTGPWRDPLGHALIDWRTPGLGGPSNIIDPGVCIDGDGNGWLAFGGGGVNKNGTNLMPGNARIVKLGKDMISIDGEIKEIPALFHFEANELNYINGKFVFSYSAGWACDAADWAGYAGRGSYACPGNCSILSMQTDNPLGGTWTYTGEILRNPGSFGYPWGNNHSHLHKFCGTWYMLYHTQALERSMGLSGGYRGIAINRITVNESTVKISPCTMLSTGPSLVYSNRMSATDTIQAECMANGAGISVTGQSGGAAVLTSIDAGDWILVRRVAFPETVKSLTARVSGAGSFEVRLNEITAAPVATVSYNSTPLCDVSVDLISSVTATGNTHDIYIVFTDVQKKTLLDYYKFNTSSIDEINAIEEIPARDVRSSSVGYSFDGRVVGDGHKGIVVKNGKKMVMK